MTGRSPDGSGYSAEPEPSCTVSAVPVSIPNARKRPAKWTERRWKNFKTNNKRRRSPAYKERVYMLFCEGGGMPTVAHSTYTKAIAEAARLSHFNRGLRFHVLATEQIWCTPASAIEAGTAETPQDGSVHESVAPQEDAHA